MKKLSKLGWFLVVLVFIMGCSQIEDSESSNKLLLNASEQSVSESTNKSNACTEAADITWSRALEYRKAVNEVRRSGKEPGSEDLTVALNRASALFGTLEGAHNQMINGCSQQPGVDPDQYEPNDTWFDAYFIGAIIDGEVKIVQANFHNPEIDQNYWYRILTSDPPEVVNGQESFDLSIELTNIPAGSNYDLFLYINPPVPIASSTQTGNSDEIITYTWNGTAGGISDDEIFYIEVRHLSGEATAELYTLTITFTQYLY
ncbi:hypothetical protein AYK24_02680 [Thermoplasmatales archaeon SG8-52-4]|nr:MAG: hypothetical protein AYK24_02680 [Thermoplasmatales archaeon SG8-52-4]